jgi:hypothetical protein
MASNDGARPRLVLNHDIDSYLVSCIEIKLNVESVKMNSEIFSIEFTKKFKYVLPNYKFLVEFKLGKLF